MNYNEEEYNAFEKRMKEQYPKMFSRPYGGIAISKGWWPILESLCANIQHHSDWKEKQGNFIPQVTVEQIKEKFGGLRFYYSGGDDVVDGMVRMAESWAGRSCEECGKPGKSRDGGWIRTLCDEHEAELRARYKKEFGDE